MSEFTGERLIPGQVEPDLWNEHIARYWFAQSLCTGGERVVDAGSGTGYGSSVLAARAASVLGFDIAPEAVDYAVEHYASESVRFVEGACDAIPAPDESADLIAAFEVIEHLDNWRAFLSECRRVLAPGGRLLISTPNKVVYNESRGDAGPNPFHMHEFQLDEFDGELRRVFPHVRMMSQNHTASVVIAGEFSEESSETGVAKLGAEPSTPTGASFFLAVCSDRPVPRIAPFVYVPEASNVLRERERHILLLERDLRAKTNEHAALVAAHDDLNVELKHSNEWATALNRRMDEHAVAIRALQTELAASNEWAGQMNDQVAQRAQRIVALQKEVEERSAWAQEREALAEERTAWARSLEADVARAAEALQSAEITAGERTTWALNLQAHIDNQLLPRLRAAEAEVERLTGSKWVRLGHALRLAPETPGPKQQ